MSSIMFLNVSHLFSRLFFIPTIILHATPLIPALIIRVTFVCWNSFSVHFGDEPIFYLLPLALLIFIAGKNWQSDKKNQYLYAK